MKISPFTVTETGFSFRKSVKKVVPFLAVGLMLAAGDSVYAYSGGNGSFARGDDYPLHYKNGSVEIDQWRMYSRQCTSFVAFRLSSVNGFEIPPAYGNANEWGHRARREGYRVDSKPEVGSIAWSTEGYYGHVAWVSNVMGDQIEIEEYNYGVRERYNRRIVKASSMTGFIHFKDLVGNDGRTGSPIESGLASSGTHTFTQKSAIRNQPSSTAQVIDYYYPGENVSYDQIVEKDGYKWLSYISNSGTRKYVQYMETEKDLVGNDGRTGSPIESGLASSGTHTFTQKSAIRNQPSSTAQVIDYYYPGENVSYDQIVEKDGYKWLSYISNSGTRRYVQYTETESVENGWKKQNGIWNYLENGKLATGWKKINGSWYHFKDNGTMSTGWVKDGSYWYYLKASGEMQTGWLKENGTWYYLESSGAMKSSQWFQVGGKYYYVNASGALAVNTTVDGYRVDSNGARI
ncbi:SH3 domain-containing protein [Streptococcus halitosis]|uniref:N-acetylmuramoyl-L-alanine amidase family protein n=1 Tax=Streptococcus halitosis TaxID=2172545 RepID=UPI00200410D6|nr:SH3 domain-containing protein [Streptococcus halitosis]MCK6129062.1 SH3 domain-containing protein [Streptococcus halitosis]MCK6216065.1 SH3 domain-containing protein [Streptococcus halitosis]